MIRSREVFLLAIVGAWIGYASGFGSQGITLFEQRRFAPAEQALRAELRRSPRDAKARLYLARTLLELNRRPEALQELQRLLEQKPDAEAQLEAGRLLRNLAQQRFRSLVAVAPDSAATLEIAGRRLEREGNFAAALEQYHAARTREPQRPGIRYALGSVYWKQRDYVAAERELRAELADSPHHAMANFRLGQVLLATERQAEAVPFLERAAQAMADVLEVRRELGKGYRKIGRNQEARAVWEAVAQARPRDDQVHYLLGGLYRELGESELARQSLERHRAILAGRRAQSERKN